MGVTNMAEDKIETRDVTDILTSAVNMKTYEASKLNDEGERIRAYGNSREQASENLIEKLKDDYRGR